MPFESVKPTINSISYVLLSLPIRGRVGPIFHLKIIKNMCEWFQAKVSSLQQMSNGLIQKLVETYLIDAMSFTEAEARAIKESEGSREVTAVSIARSPIKEVVFYGDTDQWHKVKVQYSLMDEATEKEKKVTTYFLVNAADVKEAYDRTEEHLKEMLVPFTIPKVELSPIVEVFQYEKAAPVGLDDVVIMGNGPKITEMQKGIAAEFEHEEECAMDDDSVSAIDPTDGQAVAFNPMTLETYLEDIRPNCTTDVIESIRSAYKRHGNDLFMMQLSLMAFTKPQREMIADLLANDAAFEADEERADTDLESRFDAAMKGGGND